MRYTGDGFVTALVKPERDGWLGYFEPAVLGQVEGIVGGVLRSHWVTNLVMVAVDVLIHWWTVAPWAPWSLRLVRGTLVLRMRGRRESRPLAALRRADTDDFGLTLSFDDGDQWMIPAQPADVVDLFELAGHLRRAARSARRAAPEAAAATARARRALRDVRSAPGRGR